MSTPRLAWRRPLNELRESAWDARLYTAAVVAIALMVAFAPQPVPTAVRAFTVTAALSHAVIVRAFGEAREWARRLVGAFQVLAWTCMALAIPSYATGWSSGALGVAQWVAVAIVACFPRPVLGERAKRRFADARAVLEHDRRRRAAR